MQERTKRFGVVKEVDVMQRRRQRFILTAILGCAIAAWLPLPAASAGSKVYVGAPCPEAKRVSIAKVDHSALDQLLKKYVDRRGMVDYTAWNRSAAGKGRLDQYLAHAGCVDVAKPTSREAKLAYWINLYNAVTIKGILREYPTSSIRNHTSRFFGYNIWNDLQVWVDGRRLSLKQIEHDVLRRMRDPRIHFAIVCASMGCPKLRNEAYTAEKVGEQLDSNARDFFADRNKFRADLRSRTLYVSPIMDWFDTDFGQDQSAQLKRIAKYLPTETVRAAARNGEALSVEYLDYDWSLNDQRKR